MGIAHISPSEGVRNSFSFGKNIAFSIGHNMYLLRIDGHRLPEVGKHLYEH